VTARDSNADEAPFSGSELAENLSVSALLFQARTLLDNLEAFTESDYPQQTVTIARILRLLAQRAFSELLHLNRSGASSTPDQARARDLGSIVHVLHSYLRYLHASDPLRTPPGIQRAISLLMSTHGRIALGCNREDIDVLVRPQWRYNLKYIDIIHQFEYDASCVLAYALDPKAELKAYSAEELIEALWKAAYPPNNSESKDPRVQMPKHVAVLSFAGLDRDDVLLYPLLAHELGHFLDFASDDIGNPSSESKTKQYLPTTKDLTDAGLEIEELAGIVERIGICLREITADLLAARMAGIGYLFAFNEFFKTLSPWPGPVVNPESSYPGFGLRFKLIFEELRSEAAGIGSVSALNTIIKSWGLRGKKILEDYMARLQTRADSVVDTDSMGDPAAAPSTPMPADERLIQKTVLSAIPSVRELVRGIIPADRAAGIKGSIEDMVGLLIHRIPPFQPPTRSQRQARNFEPWLFHEILTAGWLYQIAIGEERERSFQSEQQVKEYQSTCLLLLKALELEGAQDAIRSISDKNGENVVLSKPELRTTGARGHGVVSGPSIRAALDRNDPFERLVMCPDLGDGPIESASRDLHLGHWFRISKRTSLPNIDIAYSASRAIARRQGQSELFVPTDGTFILQPGDFGLAASLEYLCLPSDMMAFVEGKSSLGRAGLLIATATQVAPGFKGCIVLELFNAGTVPIILRPAMRIAQLVLVSTDITVPHEWLYSGPFQVQIKP
jgi:dCTP deaminase